MSEPKDPTTVTGRMWAADRASRKLAPLNARNQSRRSLTCGADPYSKLSPGVNVQPPCTPP
jgi:hypothetical protein